MKHSLYNLALSGQLLLLSGIANAQSTYQAENFNINIPVARNSIYEAKTEITLKDGFSCKADAAIQFDGKINPVINPSVADGGIGFLNQEVASGYDANGTTNPPPGSLPGSVDVSPTGAATYNIPLDLPKGLGGIAPQLAITYSSQAGDGLLGRGWNLAGISAITRAPQSYYYDSNSKGITFTNDDRFMLDGQRLILGSGTNGAEGSTYLKEAYDYSTITCHGNVNGGPDYFQIDTKDGSTIMYGRETPSGLSDSKVFVPGTQKVFIWLVKLIRDRRGNWIRFNYSNPEGQIKLTSIEYAGNTFASIAPACTVSFLYGTFSKSNQSYVGGTLFTSNLKLNTINLSDGRSYQFGYNIDENLQTINLFKGSLKLCNATQINYGNAPVYNTSISDPNFNKLYNNYLYNGDFDGDGKNDVAMLSPSTYTIIIKFGNGSIKNVGLPDYLYKKSSISVTDWDNNGINDIMVQCTDYYTEYINQTTTYFYQKDFVRVFTFNLNGGYSSTDIPVANSRQTNGWPNPDNYNYYYGDFNNDGHTEMIIIKNGLFFSASNSLPDPGLSDVEQIIPMDYDGDGGTEMFVLYSSNEYGEIFKFNGTSFTSIYSGIFDKKDNIFWGNLNGDGLIDYVICYSSSDWKYYINTGTGFTEGTMPSDFNTDPSLIGKQNMGSNVLNLASAVSLSDINQDGNAEIIYTKPNSGSVGCVLNVYKLQGSSFSLISSTSVTSIPANQISSMQIITTDMNSDGQSEIIFGNDDQGRVDGSAKLHEQFKKISYGSKLDDNMIVKSITNGNDVTSEVSYSYAQTLSTSSLSFPIAIFNGPLRCVSNVKVYNGTMIYSNESCTFKGGRIHLVGKGFLGFESFSRNNQTTGLKTDVFYNINSTYFIPYPYKIDVYKNSNYLSKTELTNTFSNYVGKSFIQYVSETINYDILTGHTKTTDIAINNSTGNTTSKTENFGGDGTVITNYTDYYAYGNPGKITVTKDGFVTQQVNTYSYYGNLSTSTDNDGIETSYTYLNDNTNVESVTNHANNSVVTYTYDEATRRYITNKETKLSNGITYNEKISYDSDGRPVRTEDINGLVTAYMYDDYGNKIVTVSPSGRITGYKFGWCTVSDRPSIKYYTQEISESNSISSMYYDAYGRVNRKVSYPSGGSQVTVSTFYNTDGSVSSEGASNGNSTQYTYFTNGRVQSVTTNGQTANYTYYQATTTTTVNGMPKTQTINGMGQVVTATDNGGTIAYTYHGSGQPLTITANGKTVTMGYDAKGRQTSLIDPDAGTSQYTYDSYGRLLTQTDGNSNSTTITYDDIHWRTSSKEQSKDGVSRTVSYSYYDYAPFIGKLESEEDGQSGVKVSYTYDRLGNLKTRTERIDNQNYTFSYEYDVDGKLTKTIYPDNVSISNSYTGEYITGVKDDYTGNNILSSIVYNARDQVTSCNVGYGSSATTAINQYDSYGYLQKFTIGASSNRIEYGFNFNAATQNLMSRSKKYLATTETLSEAFAFDNLDRLSSWTVSGNSTPYTMNYSGNGNITQKSDLGYYGYRSSRPHAVTDISQFSGSSIDTRDNKISYNLFGKVDTMSLKNGSFTEHSYILAYGPDDQRRKSILDVTGITIYCGLYEKRSNGDVLHYIPGAGGVSAVLVTNSSQNRRDMYYLYSDYQGSLTAVADQTGAIVKEFSYDPWGRRRNAENWNDYDSETADNFGYYGTQLFTRGYTGQEHIAYFKLINLNGRMYDPRLGRFLSPDNYVQSPTNSQSYNRYTYCLNNPLKYTDPSGYTWGIFTGSWWKHNWKSVVTTAASIGAGVLTAVTMGAASPLLIATLSGAAAGFTGGALGTALNGGSFGQCLGAGIVGGLIGAAAGLAGGAAGMGASAALKAATGISGGIIGGAFSGAVGGFVGGFVGGAATSWVGGASFNEGLAAGWKMGTIGALVGGVVGGAYGGYKAYKAGNNIWTNQSKTIGYINSDGKFQPETHRRGLREWTRQGGSGNEQYFAKIRNATNTCPTDNIPSQIDITVPDDVTVTGIEYSNQGFNGNNSLSISVNGETPLVINQASVNQWTPISIPGNVETISIINSGASNCNSIFDAIINANSNAVNVTGYQWYPRLHFF